MGDDARGGTDAADETDGSDAAGETNAADRTGTRGRDVVVPDRLYKSVTVFSTLFAVVGVVLGFVSLDVATNSGRASASEVSVPLAVLGVVLIAVGGLVYAFASRFRARGMTTDKDSDDESPDNG